MHEMRFIRDRHPPPGADREPPRTAAHGGDPVSDDGGRGPAPHSGRGPSPDTGGCEPVTDHGGCDPTPDHGARGPAPHSGRDPSPDTSGDESVWDHGGCDPTPDRGAGTGVPRDRYKRGFDLAVVALALVALAPLWVLLALGIALAIRLDDAGPLLYRQRRLGRAGRVFTIVKFRTLVPDAEAGTGPVWSREGDPRVTRVGRVLRRLHLDELPQVVNVVRGEMSLVGPRPERPELAARIERTLPEFRDRLRVRPGIAGLAQATRDGSRTPERKLHYDRLYIARMSPWLDIRLCVRCLARALSPGER